MNTVCELLTDSEVMQWKMSPSRNGVVTCASRDWMGNKAFVTRLEELGIKIPLPVDQESYVASREIYGYCQLLSNVTCMTCDHYKLKNYPPYKSKGREMKMNKYDLLGIPNHGLCWNKGDMLTIKALVAQGADWERIGKALGRRPSACKDRYRTVRIAELLNSGSSDDTLITLRKLNKK